MLRASRTDTKGRVLVVTPTRDRPRQLADLFRSMLGTSQHADLACYVDGDQRELYRWLDEDVPFKANLLYSGGDIRVGPVAAANAIVKAFPGYDAYGFVPDDCRFTVQGWDDYLMEEISDWPKRVCAVAPAVSSNGDVDMAFVSKEWVQAVGWYAHPSLYHWGWEAVIHALGAATGTLARADETRFWIEHDVLAPQNRDRYPADMVRLYRFFSSDFAPTLERLRSWLS